MLFRSFDFFLQKLRGFAAPLHVPSKSLVEETKADSARYQNSLIRGLGEDVALLRFYITEDKVGMLFSAGGAQIARESKISARDLGKKVMDLRSRLRDPKSNTAPLAQELYEVLLKPVEGDLQQAKIKTLMVSPDGVLRYLPFSALHDGQRYALERWNLPVFTSVVRDRLLDSVTPHWKAAGFGVTRRWEDFPPLPAVQNEINAIIRGSDTQGVIPGEAYIDDSFTASRLKEVSQRNVPLLHIASHFRFSPGTEINSFLLLGDGSRLTLGDIRTGGYRFNNVDMLTLSACDTALGGGRDAQGREIEGFGVIAQQQGAKAVLATLWQVADESTAALMGDIYRRRETGLTKIEALRQSQLALQKQPKYSHPYYWAPFVLMGNWK